MFNQIYFGSVARFWGWHINHFTLHFFHNSWIFQIIRLISAKISNDQEATIKPLNLKCKLESKWMVYGSNHYERRRCGSAEISMFNHSLKRNWNHKWYQLPLICNFMKWSSRGMWCQLCCTVHTNIVLYILYKLGIDEDLGGLSLPLIIADYLSSHVPNETLVQHHKQTIWFFNAIAAAIIGWLSKPKW